MTRTLTQLLLVGLLPLLSGSLWAQTVVEPASTIHLFDGKSLDQFETWLVDQRRADPDRVFSVVDQIDGAPAIRISGERWGGIATRNAYRNYRLVVEYRWGEVTWGDRRDRTRDSGVLLHALGPLGNTAEDFNGPWMHSVEFQIIEGGVGDIIAVAGYSESGELMRPSLKVKSRRDRDGEAVYDPTGVEAVYDRGRINWWGRSVAWEDRLGFRGAVDVDSPLGEWTRLEAVCDGDRLTYFVNGTVVNEAYDSSLTEGRIMLQSEGAEIYFRRIDLGPVR